MNSEQAKKFALKIHGDQKYGDQPYEVHLSAVSLVLATFGYIDEPFASAAWLHDALEDDQIFPMRMHFDINQRFGPQVATLVWAVTGTGANRRERNESIYQKLALIPSAIPIKLADRIANVEAAKAGGTRHFDMYFTEHDEFQRRLKPLRVEVAMWKRLNAALGVSS